MSSIVPTASTTGTYMTQRRWPAEYESHYGCILLFPKPSKQTAYCGPTTMSSILLFNAQNAVLDVITAIVKNGKEDVYLFCDSQDMSHPTTVITYLQERKLPYVVTFDHPMKTSSISSHSSSISAKVYVMLCPSEDTWARDTGPTFVVVEETYEEWTSQDENNEGASTRTPKTIDPLKTKLQLVGLDWEFNAYGGKDDGCYWPYTLDEQIAYNMIQSINNSSTSPSSSDAKTMMMMMTIQHEKIASLILEGGSIHTDGEGTILTTKECLLNPNRNPNLTPDEIEHIILTTTGCIKMIWLDQGLAYDDDTNGHIDNWACFVKPGHIVLAWTDDIDNDPINYKNCRESYTVLQNSTDAKNRSFILHKMYLPSPPIHYIDHMDVTSPDIASTVTTSDMENGSNVNDIDNAEVCTTVLRTPGTQMAASYVNFYIANEAVIVPQFNNPIYDQKAIELLQSLFSNDDIESPKEGRTVIGIHSSRHILYGGGNIHCITQQIPMV